MVILLVTQFVRLFKIDKPDDISYYTVNNLVDKIDNPIILVSKR